MIDLVLNITLQKKSKPFFYPFFVFLVNVTKSWNIYQINTRGRVVQSPISANTGLTFNKTYRVNLGLALIGL